MIGRLTAFVVRPWEPIDVALLLTSATVLAIAAHGVIVWAFDLWQGRQGRRWWKRRLRK